jgi:nucleotide-binding universal stress UspA family protein
VRYKKIVVATDGSGPAQRALDVAGRLATDNRAGVWVVHGYEQEAAAADVVAQAVVALEARGLKPKVEKQVGSPAGFVVETADVLDADLIVVGSRGLSPGQRFLLGSVSSRIAHHAPCDVLVVRRGGSGDDRTYRKVLIATDGSATADRASRRALGLAGRLGWEATLVFVGHPATGELILKDTVEQMAEDVPTTTRMLQGDPAERILEAADEERADLVVVGNKGMGGARRFLLGSVPQKVMEYSPTDVLIVRTVTQALSELGKGEGGIVAVAGSKVAVYRDEKGTTHALSAKCTHMGCTVRWNGTDRTWDCPCHGSRFSPTGEVVEGPASKPLPPTAL